MLGGACSQDALSARIRERKVAEFADTYCGFYEGSFRTPHRISVPQLFSFFAAPAPTSDLAVEVPALTVFLARSQFLIFHDIANLLQNLDVGYKLTQYASGTQIVLVNQ